jgi:hypothetical protein
MVAFNVVFLRFGNTWHRLCFDFGIIFWRANVPPPASSEEPVIEASYPVVNIGTELGIVGSPLHRYEMTSIEGGSRVEFFSPVANRLCSKTLTIGPRLNLPLQHPNRLGARPEKRENPEFH